MAKGNQKICKKMLLIMMAGTFFVTDTVFHSFNLLLFSSCNKIEGKGCFSKSSGIEIICLCYCVYDTCWILPVHNKKCDSGFILHFANGFVDFYWSE